MISPSCIFIFKYAVACSPVVFTKYTLLFLAISLISSLLLKFDSGNKSFESIPKTVPNTNVVYKHALQRVFSQLIAENKIWNIEHPDSFIKERIDE